MVKSPGKSCPSLYQLIENVELGAFVSFLRQDEFSRQSWLDRYRDDEGADRVHLEALLHEEKKSRLEPLEIEASRILQIAEARGQYALDGLARAKLKPAEQANLKAQRDEIHRSLWVYLNNRLLFEAVEGVLHHRLYRRYGKHYQSFRAAKPGEQDATSFEAMRDELIAEIESRLDMGVGCQVERFEVPSEHDMPAAEMYIIYHPNPPTSARELREDGERRRIYFRPPGEATIVYTPSTGAVEVRGETRLIRQDVAESFVQVALGQDLSNQPLDYREYDLSRFLDGFSLDIPSVAGFHVRSAGVIRAEISVRHLGNRLSLATTIHEDIDRVIDGLAGLRAIFRRAVAIRFVEIAVRYSLAGETTERTLDFTMSDQNSCSLLSLPDERERVLGHRLLRHWGVLRELRGPDDEEKRRIMPLLLEIWDSGDDTVSGGWLKQRGVDETQFTSTGFLEPAGWEDVDLIDDDANGLVDAKVATDTRKDRELAYHQPTDEVLVAAGDADRFRTFRVNRDWLVEYVTSALSKALDVSVVEELSADLTCLGSLDVEGAETPVYLARGLADPKSLAAIGETFASRSNIGIGLVLCADRGPFRCLGANVLCSLVDHLAEPGHGGPVSAEKLRTIFKNNRVLARGGRAVELVWDGGERGELFVPGKGSIQIPGYNRLLVLDRLVKAHNSGPFPRAPRELCEGLSKQQLPNVFGKTLWEQLNGRFIRSLGHGAWGIAA